MAYRCHCTLAEMEEEGFSSLGRKLLTGGNRRFPHRLPYRRPDISTIQLETAEHLSISGVQDKIAMRLVRGALKVVDTAGEYILTPVPSRPLPLFDEYESDFYRQNAFSGAEDFLHLALLFGIKQKRAEAVLQRFPNAHERTTAL